MLVSVWIGPKAREGAADKGKSAPRGSVKVTEKASVRTLTVGNVVWADFRPNYRSKSAALANNPEAACRAGVLRRRNRRLTIRRAIRPPDQVGRVCPELPT